LQQADPPSRGVLPYVCLCVCVIECDQVQQYPLHLQCVGRRGPTEKERKKEKKERNNEWMNERMKEERMRVLK